MGCAGRSKRWQRGDGMRRPIEEMAARQGDAPAKIGGKFVQSMEHHLRKEELGERDDSSRKLVRLEWIILL